MPDPVVTPAVPVAPVAAAKPKSILDVLSGARAKAIDPTVVPAPVVAKPAVIAPVVKKPAEPDTAAELAALKAENATLKASVAGKEKEVTDLAAIREAQELWKKGDRVGAISKLSGVDDPDGELDELVKAYVARPAKTEKDAVTLKLEQIEAEQAAAKAEREAERKANDDRTVAEKKAAAERADKDAAKYASDILTKNAEKFELCAKEGNRAEVCAKVTPIAFAILKRDKIDFETLTAEQAEAATVEALTEIEKDLVKEGETRFWARPEKGAQPARTAPVVAETTVPSTATPMPKLETLGKADSIETVLKKARQNASYS